MSLEQAKGLNMDRFLVQIGSRFSELVGNK